MLSIHHGFKSTMFSNAPCLILSTHLVVEVVPLPLEGPQLDGHGPLDLRQLLLQHLDSDTWHECAGQKFVQ